MYDQTLFMSALSRFARELPSRYDVDVALAELTETVTAVLELSGSGVSLAEQGRLRFVTAVSSDSVDLEQLQEELQMGPCRDAYETGVVVSVYDVRRESARWPEFSAEAARLGVAGMAGVPMRLAGKPVGALNLYVHEPRIWPAQDIAVAEVLADVFTAYIINGSKLRQQEELARQLQFALDSRVIIEQAKGITANQRGLSVDQAFDLLRRHARSNNASLRSVAEAVVRVDLKL